MSVPTPLVEIGFDLNEAPNFFKLDDPIRGQLDSTYILGGQIFYDVTDKVKSIAVQRGKNRQLDFYEPGLANVVFDNNDRTFDPEYTASPYYGQIIPKRAIRISSAGILQFVGVIDDWGLNYDPNGDSTASAACSDAFSYFATQTLAARTWTSQKSGQRVEEILDDPDVDWPQLERSIETGVMTLAADTIADDTNVLSYLRTIEKTEPGSFFMGKNGYVTFKDRITPATSGGLTFADDGTGIAYQGMKVVYGSEFLYNEIVIGSETAGTAIAQDTGSIGEYGVLNLTQTGLLMANALDVANVATFYANKYSQPEYRFESIDILVDQLSPAEQTQILDLELGSVVQIKFTPNGIAPAISKYAEVIRIDHSVDPINHIVSFGFATLDFTLLVLDDPQFGKLDSGNALAF